MKSQALLLAAALTVSGCGGISSSSFNPFNWFGSDEPEALDPLEVAVIRDARPLVAQVTNMAVEPATGGVILRARGAVPVAGWHSTDLVLEPEQSGNGVLTYSFRAEPPEQPSPGSGNARLVTAATFIDTKDLQGIREIRVRASTNIRAARP